MPLETFLMAPATAAQFVEFWTARYHYPQGALYDNNIGLPLTADRVWELYEWKNGSPIAPGKKASVQNIYIPEIPRLPVLTSIQDGRSYLTRLRTGETGGVWDIFWLHCISPSLFPIFDQHTYRAMRKIMHGTVMELSKRRNIVLTAYFDEYLPFLNEFMEQDGRNVDRALFAYGRFLNSDFFVPELVAFE